MAGNKVKFGLKNAHYAVGTPGDEGTMTYGTVKPIKGSVSISLSANSSDDNFYADDVAYYKLGGSTGYSGNYEAADLPIEFMVDVFGDIIDSNGALIENTGGESKPFALLFEMTGDKNGRRHVLYNCTATRPDVSASTNEASKTVTTDSTPITCDTIHIPGIDIDSAKCRAEKGDACYEGWFNEVYIPMASGSEETDEGDTDDTDGGDTNP